MRDTPAGVTRLLCCAGRDAQLKKIVTVEMAVGYAYVTARLLLAVKSFILRKMMPTNKCRAQVRVRRAARIAAPRRQRRRRGSRRLGARAARARSGLAALSRRADALRGGVCPLPLPPPFALASHRRVLS